MKKMNDLENRWRSYKYGIIVRYVFAFVFIVFLACVGAFVYMKYFKNAQIGEIAKVNQSSNAAESNAVDSTPHQATNQAQSQAKPKPSVNFICRQVIADKLTVRTNASFKSTPKGYYLQDSIFCADAKAKNGLIKTANGWVSANNRFSKVIDSNMYVDFGFYKYKQNPTQQTKIAQAPIQEVRVLDQNPQQVANTRQNTQIVNSNTFSPPTPPKPRPAINITSETVTTERTIELKKADFNKTKDYFIAIQIAEYYYNNKDYENSLKWALNASNANSAGKQKFQSWIIYSKSLYATGKKEQAISVLDQYVARTDSKVVKEVLNDMRRGVI